MTKLVNVGIGENGVDCVYVNRDLVISVTGFTDETGFSKWDKCTILTSGGEIHINKPMLDVVSLISGKKNG